MAQTGQVGGRDGLDRNTSGTPSAPPSVEAVPDSTRAANTSSLPGGYVSNGQHLPAAPAGDDDVAAPAMVATIPGGYVSNRQTGPRVPALGI